VQIPVVNLSTNVSDEDMAYVSEACQDTLAACAKDWGVAAPAVIFYGKELPTELPPDAERVAEVVDDLSEAPGAEAYHTDENGVIFSRTLAGSGASLDVVSVGLDHENKEELVDPECDQTVTMPDGRLLAKEICDPVQGDTRKVEVTIGSLTRSIAVSNYVLPSYFDPNGKAPYDAFGLVSKPFECRPGGYQEITDLNGKTDYVFADMAAANALLEKRANPTSRLYRRIAKRAEALKAFREAPTEA
jgi:hypothetical protein